MDSFLKLFIRKEKVKKKNNFSSFFFKRVSTSTANQSKNEKFVNNQKKKNGIFSLNFFQSNKSTATKFTYEEKQYSKEAEDFILNKAIDTREINKSLELTKSKRFKFRPEKIYLSKVSIYLKSAILVLSISSYFIIDFFVIKPFLEDQEILVKEKQKFETEIVRLSSLNPLLEKNINEFNEIRTSYEEYFYPKNGTDRFYDLVTSVASKHELNLEFEKGKINSVFNQSQSPLFDMVPITLKLNGGYLNYLRFKREIELTKEHIKVLQEQVNNDKNSLNIELKLVILLKV